MPKLPTLSEIGRAGNNPFLLFIKTVMRVWAPAGGFLTFGILIFYAVQWVIYLVEVDKMDIFEAIPIQYKISAIAIGMLVIVLFYVKKYFEATKDNDAVKFDAIYILSMLFTIGVGAYASYYICFHVLGSLEQFSGVVVTEPLTAIMWIASITVVVTYAIDKVLFHQIGDWLYLAKQKKRRKAPDEKETQSILTAVKGIVGSRGFTLLNEDVIKDTLNKNIVKETVSVPGNKEKGKKEYAKDDPDSPYNK